MRPFWGTTSRETVDVLLMLFREHNIKHHVYEGNCGVDGGLNGYDICIDKDKFKVALDLIKEHELTLEGWPKSILKNESSAKRLTFHPMLGFICFVIFILAYYAMSIYIK